MIEIEIATTHFTLHLVNSCTLATIKDPGNELYDVQI